MTIEERRPVLVWQVGARRYLADADGELFALLGAETAARRGRPARSSTTGGRRRPACRSTGSSTPSTSTRRPGSPRSCRPTSGAGRLAGRGVTDENGFILDTRPKGWSAVFGFYTPSLRTTELIPGQVRLLRSLLAGREQLVERVILASETDGTYMPRATPDPPKPSKAP